jgi:hypothetical protein
MYGPVFRDPESRPPENLKTVISGSLAKPSPKWVQIHGAWAGK